VTAGATAVEDRLHVAEVFDVLDARRISESRLVLRIPFLARFVFRLARQERRLRGEVEERIIGPGRRGLFEERRLLAVGVATAAVVTDFAGPQLVPRLRHVEDHAALVERLERERGVGRNAG